MLPFRFRGYQRTNGRVAGKNVRPQTHRTLRYTIAHLFRVRLCNRSYVTEEAVRLPQNYERPSELRENVTRATSLRRCSRCSLSARFLLLLFLRPARPHHAGNLIFADVVHSMTASTSFRESMTRLYYAPPKNIKHGEKRDALASGAWFLSKPVITANRRARNSNSTMSSLTGGEGEIGLMGRR